MESIIVNLITSGIIIFNLTICFKEIKKAYKIEKDKKINFKKDKQKLNQKKKQLKIKLQCINEMDLQTPLYGKLTKEEAQIFLKITEKLKMENTEIYIFANELCKHVKLEQLRNFMKNAPYIKIARHNKRPNKKLAGSFSVLNKEVNIYVNKKNVLYHELLHAASADFSYDRVGFKIYLKEIGYFGEGINEGYTELLNDRFFQAQEVSYIVLKHFVKLIEQFYENKEEMMTDYFNTDTFKLIGELMKSMTLEETIDILVDLDQFLELKNFKFTDYLKLKHKIIKLYTQSHNAEEINQFKKICKEKVLVKTLKP